LRDGTEWAGTARSTASRPSKTRSARRRAVARPRSGRIAIKSLGRKSGLANGEISSVRLLGHSASKLEWSRGDEALTVALPAEKPSAHALALEIKGLLDDH